MESWAAVALSALGIGGGLAGVLVYSQKSTVRVLCRQIESRTAEAQSDRDEFLKGLSAVAGGLSENATATRELAGVMRGDRRTAARRFKETTAQIERLGGAGHD